MITNTTELPFYEWAIEDNIIKCKNGIRTAKISKNKEEMRQFRERYALILKELGWEGCAKYQEYKATGQNPFILFYVKDLQTQRIDHLDVDALVQLIKWAKRNSISNIEIEARMNLAQHFSDKNFMQLSQQQIRKANRLGKSVLNHQVKGDIDHT